jgi:hypothetical protein
VLWGREPRFVSTVCFAHREANFLTGSRGTRVLAGFHSLPGVDIDAGSGRQLNDLKGIVLNTTRIALAAAGAFVAYFALGGLFFGLLPSLRNEFLKYPAVYRSQEGIKAVMPAGMLGMLLAMVVLAVLYAMLYKGGSGLAEGARFGALIAVFSVCTFVLHNYVNLNIGLALTLQQAVAYSVEWIAVGVVIGLIYRP